MYEFVDNHIQLWLEFFQLIFVCTMMLIFEYLFWLIEFIIPKLLSQLGVHNLVGGLGGRGRGWGSLTHYECWWK